MSTLKNNIAISDAGFVFDPSTGESFTLNETGMKIFSLLKEGKNPEEIKATMTGEYDVDSISFDRYYQDFLEMLHQYNLVEDEKEI